MQPSIPLEVINFNLSSSSSFKGEEDFIASLNLSSEGGRRVPVIIRGLDLGPCLHKWSKDYLKNNNNPETEKKVKVHKSKDRRLDFIQKNFTYETISFRELIEKCVEDKENFWYLRSLGDDPRGKDVSDLRVHFPSLSQDVRIPPGLFPPSSFFSSVFRVTSASLQLWTHYDTCDNILFQIKGRKKVILFRPCDALNLYLEGDKSVVLNVDETPDLEKFPKLKGVTKYEGILEEGDILFIPALWFHNITALEFSVSVNVFWKNLGEEFYDKKDTYGNRELIPAQLAFKTFENATSQLKSLPKEYEDFYLRRMIIQIQKRLDNLSVVNDKKKEEKENLQ